MDRSTNRTDLISLVAITGVLTIALHQLGNIQELSVDWADPLQWAAAAAPEELIGSVARYTGLALGYWVLTTTTLYFAWGVRNMRPPRLVTLLTIPAVRRIVDRTLAATLAATVVLGPVRPALAEAPPPPPPIVFETADDGIPVPHIRMGQPEETSAPITEPEEQPVASTPSPPTQQPVVPAPSAVAMTATHTVAGGENLGDFEEPPGGNRSTAG